MAEEQVMPRGLVLDSNHDKLAKRIGGVTSALKEELLTRQKSAFCEFFLHLCKEYFQLRKSDILKIEDNEELLILEFEVFKRVNRAYKFMKYVLLPLIGWIPFIGWAMAYEILSKNVCDLNNTYSLYYGNGLGSLNYCKLRRILIEKYGKDFFSFETLINILKTEEPR